MIFLLSVPHRPRKFLIVDSNADNGVLLARSLARKFPAAVVQMCGVPETAYEILGAETVDAVVLHRADEQSAVEMIEQFVKIAPDVPVIGVSGVARSGALLSAGAVGFLNYEEWLRIGTVVQNLLHQREGIHC